MTSHPCHQSQIARLRRAEGQIRGVVRLINDGEYCIDILNQLKA
ncbi:MAG: metal-sensitive transcriptional regulator, partial [Pseudomonadota bacterium]|nr:metal-sensitive transcriptional regulator [Pseudomonadota bacterium]